MFKPKKEKSGKNERTVFLLIKEKGKKLQLSNIKEQAKASER